MFDFITGLTMSLLTAASLIALVGMFTWGYLRLRRGILNLVGATDRSLLLLAQHIYKLEETVDGKPEEDAAD